MYYPIMSRQDVKYAEQEYFESINCSDYLIGEVAKCLYKALNYIFNKSNSIDGKKSLSQPVKILNSKCERVQSIDIENTNILIICGKGNNGADGYALANLLQDIGIDYTVYCAEEAKAQDCVNAFNKIPVNKFITKECLKEKIEQYMVVVDCIYGIGFYGECNSAISEVIELINQAKVILSCDIPSGLDCNCGRASKNTIEADYTLAVGVLKYGHFLGDGKDFCGELIIANVGLNANPNSPNVYVGEDMDKIFPPRKNNTHKGSYGSLVVVADSNRYIGAGLLAYVSGLNILGECSMAVGTGYCRLSVPEKVNEILSQHVIHCCLLPRKDVLSANASAIAIGMGMLDTESELLYDIVANATCPVLIDAEGLNILAKNPTVLTNKKSDIVLTPHIKEFSRLIAVDTDTILSSPIDIVRQYAKLLSVTIVLKGVTTVVSDGYNTCLVPNGMPGLAKGGSGDVLSGIIGGLLARGVTPYSAARAGVYIHSEAAKHALKSSNEYSLMPMDVANAVSSIINKKINVNLIKIITP